MILHDYLLEAYPDLVPIQRDAAFAERVGVTRQTIHRYRTFQRFPSPEMISRIRDETNGVVTADDHLPPELRESPELRARRFQIEKSIFQKLLDSVDLRDVNRRIIAANSSLPTKEAA